MSTTTIRVLTPRRFTAPRGATLVGAIVDAVRAYRSYRAAANARKRAAADAESVRRLAARMQHSDPGMAADLRAAADRHIGAY